MLSFNQVSRFFLLFLSASTACTVAAHGQNQGHEADTLEVAFVGPALPASDKESADVLSALHKLLSALGQRNIEQIGACLSPDVTMFDDRTGKVVSGKEAVLEHVKSKVIGRESTTIPVKRIAVYSPFVRIKGETAMVSFRATKKMADESKLESWCSEVYERKDGQWLVLQFRTNWKPTKSPD